MKRSIWRNKKGQIQGVDFALAMIVFMIMFTEVIVLSLSFLEPKYQNLDSEAFETRAGQVSNTFFMSAGYPNNWEYDYTSNFNSFGLRQVGSSSLDANKIARITPNNLFSIDYQNLKRNISREEDMGFQFRIESLFRVRASLTLTQPTGTIDIETSLGGCSVWVFVVAPNNTVIYTQRDKTDSLGLLSLPVNLGATVLPNGYYTVIVFAESQLGIFAIDYSDVIIGPSVNFGFKTSIQESEVNNGLTYIQTYCAQSLTALGVTVLFPFLPGGDAYSNEVSIISSPNTNEIFELRMPTNGTSVVIINANSPVGVQRKTYIYPSLLNDDLGTTYGESIVPENKELIKIENLVIIRECIFKAVLYIWPE
ncbi:MAG: hypothetical protein JXA54_16820 [Candidatus Heimdallarchaeota archaeon]|nr:hypothetical protein [Candidatus Heimdallarchaeota archaeon]